MRVSIFMMVLLFAFEAAAEEVTQSWTDPNFAFCEGIGALATSRVDARAKFERRVSDLHVTSLSFLIHNQHPHQPNGRISWVNPDGSRATVQLQEPWFSVVREGGSRSTSLYLPRARTDAGEPSPAEQRDLSVKAGTELEIEINLLFSVPGGSCPTKFTTTWKIG